MENAKAWTEQIVIPTYGTGKPNKNPMFFEKRVYQGSSGKVYPYPVIDTLEDERVDREYCGIFLENQYIKILVLPEIGGKIHRAYDKTNGYDFVYHNEVIKPALVGLLGPWVSGGIEFNWPQHHRPTTFMAVDFSIEQSEGECCRVKVHDHDRISGTDVVTEFCLHSDKSYIEIHSSVFNPTASRQTFLWWANPAVAVNDNTQSIFPPDVHAVYDHGKRAVSRFPIACGEYYKYDYSEGVDISRYKNIPVPTSYMAYRSKYDFVGGYDYGQQAGILHVADHHISPGKKQWTWGCGDFGKAWDKNLTDANGPYIELMTGIYTDNQPDFSWLQPYEEKHFTQYFLPYKGLGAIANATKDMLLSLDHAGNCAKIGVYATGPQKQLRVVLEGERLYAERSISLTPESCFIEQIDDIPQDSMLCLKVYDRDGRELICYRPETPKVEPLPEPAIAPNMPADVKTNEELYLIGRHIEQYRHATYLPDPYYLEGLRRDADDMRINTAMAGLYLRRGSLAEAEGHCLRAIQRQQLMNTNPADSETHLLYGFVLFYLDRVDEAYEQFYKATWSQAQCAVAFTMLSFISAQRGNWGAAASFSELALQHNSKNTTARFLSAFCLQKSGDTSGAINTAVRNIEENPFDYGSALILEQLSPSSVDFDIDARIGGRPDSYLCLARDYGRCACYGEALAVLDRYGDDDALVAYHSAYYASLAGKDALPYLRQAALNADACRFPVTLEDQKALMFALEIQSEDSLALYLLGNLCYDKLRYDEAFEYWKRCTEIAPEFPTAHRNLAIVYFNKRNDPGAALAEMESAFDCDTGDARIFYELDQLYKRTGMQPAHRLELFQKYGNLVQSRDDLKVEFATLLNLTGRYQEALSYMQTQRFHPWEGGEGKVSSQYVVSLRELALEQIASDNYARALELLQQSLVYPENLGEGKLIGRKDNDIHYFMGLCYRKLGDEKLARQQFALATEGDSEPAPAMFYNDQPADMIFYQGLAWRQLGDEKAAKSRFYSLLDYGEQHYFDDVRIDFFAVSLPDIQLFDDDLNRNNEVHCSFLLGLGKAGLGKTEEARQEFQSVLESNPAHVGAHFLIHSAAFGIHLCPKLDYGVFMTAQD